MKKILFTVALNVTDRPSRWKHVSKAYYALSLSLSRLGFKCQIFINRESIHSCLKENDYIIQNNNLEEVIANYNPDISFIWGGRTPADKKTINSILSINPACKIIYSEAGWFPQRGTVYFDTIGTNADASFSQKNYTGSVTKKEINHFLKLRKTIIRKDLDLFPWSKIPQFHITPPDLNKKILIPLQDENDTNIINSSPFKTMKEFIEFVSYTYPNQNFIVREHPRARSKNLPQLSNIEYQNSKVPLFKQYKDIGMVLGINSTVLLQSAMHNKTVIALGEGLVSPGQCVFNMDINNPVLDLSQIKIDSNIALERLTLLLIRKQLIRKKLSNSNYIKNSYIYDNLNQ